MSLLTDLYTGAQAQQECEELTKQLESAGIGGAEAAGDDGKLGVERYSGNLLTSNLLTRDS